LKPKFRIQVENSAPSQAQAAKSVLWASSILSILGVNRVADLGCGRLRNLEILQKHFSEITLVDTEFQCSRISTLVPSIRGIRLKTIDDFMMERRTYEAVFLISVLHVIPKPRDRKESVLLAHSKLRKGGYLAVDVPTGESYYRQRCTKENRYSDGWLMGVGDVRTFYKNYLTSEFDQLISSNTSFTLFQKTYVDHHIIRIWQKSK
jgi:trans-aconitate methyltransferase